MPGFKSPLAPTASAPVPANTALAVAIELDEALQHLITATHHMERLELEEGKARCLMARSACEDAIDELHADDPEVDDDE